MEFFRRAAGSPKRLGVFPGTFNPPTVAHLAIAQSSLDVVDEVVFVLPRLFPHKHYSGASFEDRIQLLLDSTAMEESFSVASTSRGLFADIAAGCRDAYGTQVRLSFLGGRDAAERIVGWDYGERGAIAGMLRDFDLLVAARDGVYRPPEDVAQGVRQLAVGADIQAVSASGIRDRIAAGLPWEHLVPELARDRVRRIYAAEKDITVPDSRAEK